MKARLVGRTAMVLIFLPIFWAAGAACGSSHTRAAQKGCEALGVRAADVASSVGWAPTATHSVPGDSQSCEFGSGARHLQVSVRPTLGRVTVESWIAGRMPLRANTFAGAGEAAVWQPDLHELIAEQNDVLCDVSVSGEAVDSTSVTSSDLAHRLANLCNKIFGATSTAADRAAHSPWRSK